MQLLSLWSQQRKHAQNIGTHRFLLTCNRVPTTILLSANHGSCEFLLKKMSVQFRKKKVKFKSTDCEADALTQVWSNFLTRGPNSRLPGLWRAECGAIYAVYAKRGFQTGCSTVTITKLHHVCEAFDSNNHKITPHGRGVWRTGCDPPAVVGPPLLQPLRQCFPTFLLDCPHCPV